jgi:DNA-binding Lrp family transcriptional regulator
MDRADRELLSVLEEGIPLVDHPFREIGRRVHMGEDEVLERVRRLKEEGVIRKVRARINQRLAGIEANALVAWKPSGANVALLAASPAVTHCYERRPAPGKWEYTVYTVHHGRTREAVLAEVRALANRTGIDEYVVLFSTWEFKRVPNVRVGENGGGPV